METKKIYIDPEKFAYHVIAGFQPEENNDVAASKMMLTRYLTAYYLIEQFNHLEEAQFNTLNNIDYNKILTFLGTIKFH